MKVIKSSGEIEDFRPRKIYATIKEAGGSTKLARNAIKEVKSKYHKNFTTKEILEIVLNYLKDEPRVQEKYNLKRAIMNLGPTGYPFEKFFARVLEEYGFKTLVGQKLKGKNIYHEIDVDAKKKKRFMIECKYHNESGTLTRLHPAMYTYARFLDVKKHGFDKSWLVTNTKCSLDARRYAKGVGLKITSWKYPEKQSLQKLIEKKNLYPITIINEIDDTLKEKFFEKNIIILKDFEIYSIQDLIYKFHIRESKAVKIMESVNALLAN